MGQTAGAKLLCLLRIYAQNVSMHLCVIKHPEAAVLRSHPSDSLSFMDTGIVSTGTVRTGSLPHTNARGGVCAQDRDYFAG